jgi:hypothetical protein
MLSFSNALGASLKENPFIFKRKQTDENLLKF